MEIRQLKAFRSVATLMSFHRAAEQLHYAQSSISAQIQALEADLGVQLFDRLGRRILLTEAGERLLQYAEKILDLAGCTDPGPGWRNDPFVENGLQLPKIISANS